jgi:hypothetical protein
MSETAQAAAKKPSAADDSSEERQDSSGPHASFVNAIRGTILFSGEILLDWGLNESTPAGPRQTISLSHRLVLNPALVQELIGLLHKLLYAHAQTFRPNGRLPRDQTPAPPADSPPSPESNDKAP